MRESMHLPHRILGHYRSIIEGGLIAGGTSDRRGRQDCFFSAMDPLEKSLPEVFKNSPKESFEWYTFINRTTRSRGSVHL